MIRSVAGDGARDTTFIRTVVYARVFHHWPGEVEFWRPREVHLLATYPLRRRNPLVSPIPEFR